jgi:hypothetical protein
MPPKPKPQKRNRRHYTYNVTCSFALQYTFTHAEVEQDSEGDEGDLVPTDKALRRLDRRIAKSLGNDFCVSFIEAHADSDDLLGVDAT